MCEDATELGATQTFSHTHKHTHQYLRPPAASLPPPAASLFVRCGSQHVHVTFQPQTLPLTRTHTLKHTFFSAWPSYGAISTAVGQGYLTQTHTLTFIVHTPMYTHMNAHRSHLTSFIYIRGMHVRTYAYCIRYSSNYILVLCNEKCY